MKDNSGSKIWGLLQLIQLHMLKTGPDQSWQDPLRLLQSRLWMELLYFSYFFFQCLERKSTRLIKGIPKTTHYDDLT